MATLTAFRALRPAPEAATRVSSVPYDVVSAAEARALATDPFSFLHVTRSEIDLPPDTDPHSDGVYARARLNLAELKRAVPLLQEQEPALYVYRQRMGDHVQSGIAGCFGVDEYERGTIKKHEKTRRDKEDDRTRHICELRAQTGLVFLTHRPSEAVRALAAEVAESTPLYDFVAPDGIAHTLWRANATQCEGLVAGFAAIDALYIADGHHRAASAHRARQELRDGRDHHPSAPGAGDFNTFVAVAFPADELKVLPYNRVVLDLGGHTVQSLRAELEQRFQLAPGPAVPSERGRISVYLDGAWSTMTLPAPGPRATAIARLDVSRLQDHVLAPLLDIGDPRTSERIAFVGGIRGTGELERLVDSGAAAIAFSLLPVGVEQLMEISDADEIMPPKSTWFEPKLRDGLLIHEI